METFSIIISNYILKARKLFIVVFSTIVIYAIRNQNFSCFPSKQRYIFFYKCIMCTDLDKNLRHIFYFFMFKNITQSKLFRKSLFSDGTIIKQSKMIKFF